MLQSSCASRVLGLCKGEFTRRYLSSATIRIVCVNSGSFDRLGITQPNDLKITPYFTDDRNDDPHDVTEVIPLYKLGCLEICTSEAYVFSSDRKY
ncbi:hypothetical protein OPQ81_009912 [Rhizoctonia solani]|nr:hypothetical protein OPQ81_009912 [Rhizoctonia solani]